MEMLTLIIALSTIMWYIIDRLKGLWETVPYSKYITTIVAAIGAAGIVFTYNLDVVCAVGLIENSTIAGKILTSLCLMGGSSAISEVITKIKKTSSKTEE